MRIYAETTYLWEGWLLETIFIYFLLPYNKIDWFIACPGKHRLNYQVIIIYKKILFLMWIRNKQDMEIH